MLSRSCTKFSGFDVHALYPHGVPKRTFPYREHPKQIATAPTPGGFYITRHALGWPFQIPFEWLFYRSSIFAFVACVMYDLFFGLPLPLMKEVPPGTPKHFFFNNAGGSPHHLWQFQDGWKIFTFSQIPMEKWRGASFMEVRCFLEKVRHQMQFLKQEAALDEEPHYERLEQDNVDLREFHSPEDNKNPWISLIDNNSEANDSSTLGSTDKPPIPFTHTSMNGSVILAHNNELLGRGTNSEVFRGTMQVSGMPPEIVAVQIIHVSIESIEDVDRWIRVISLRESIAHPYFIQCYYIGLPDGCDINKFDMYAALEFASGGSVDALLKKNERLNVNLCRQILRDTLHALCYLHDVLNIVHNDLKPHNILAVKNEENSTVRYKLCDIDAMYPALNSDHKSDKVRSYGTPFYMSPESCRAMPFLTSNDIWSLGIVAYYLSTGRLPWNPLELQVPSLIIHGFKREKDTYGPTLHEFNETDTTAWPQQLKDLIYSCLHANPAARPTSSAVLQSSFFTSVTPISADRNY